MVRDFLVLVAFVTIGVVYLASSGETPENVKLPLQIGVTIVTGGMFLFFERFINRIFGSQDDNETLDELRSLRDEVAELSAEIEQLREDILEGDVAR